MQRRMYLGPFVEFEKGDKELESGSGSGVVQSGGGERSIQGRIRVDGRRRERKGEGG
jgi:hypothetical protein